MKKIVYLLTPLMALSLLASCGGNNPPEPTVYHTITFKGTDCYMIDEIGGQVSEKQFEAGQIASYHLVGKDGYEIPKESNFNITYTKTGEKFDGTYSYRETDGALSVKMTDDVTVTASSNQCSAISKVVVKNGEDDYCETVFDYFDDNQYVETVYDTRELGESNAATIDHKMYHIIEKTDDYGYVDYSANAYPSEENGEFELGDETYIDTYNASGKITRSACLYTKEKLEEYYPGCDYSKLDSIDLTFKDFATTKFYCTYMYEFSYDTNYNKLKSMFKQINNNDNILELVTTSMVERIYNDKGLLVEEYRCEFTPLSSESEPEPEPTITYFLLREKYTYDAKGFLTDTHHSMLEANGDEKDFLAFLTSYDFNSSFEDYTPGFTENMGWIFSTLYKETADSNKYETEQFQYDSAKKKYFLTVTEADDKFFGGYTINTYGENGSCTEDVYYYDKPEDEGQTRDNLKFINLTLKGIYKSIEHVFDEYKDCIKSFTTDFIDGESVIESGSYEYTIVGDKITKYLIYEHDSDEGGPINMSFEYKNTNNDYRQTHSWIYNNTPYFDDLYL